MAGFPLCSGKSGGGSIRRAVYICLWAVAHFQEREIGWTPGELHTSNISESCMERIIRMGSREVGAETARQEDSRRGKVVNSSFSRYLHCLHVYPSRITFCSQQYRVELHFPFVRPYLRAVPVCTFCYRVCFGMWSVLIRRDPFEGVDAQICRTHKASPNAFEAVV